MTSLRNACSNAFEHQLLEVFMQHNLKTLALTSAFALGLFSTSGSLWASADVSEVAEETEISSSTPKPTVIAVWDKNEDGKLNFKEIPAYVKSKLDFDGDGRLTISDIGAGFKKLFDRNGDGHLNFSDVIQLKDDIFSVGKKITDLMTKIQSSDVFGLIPEEQKGQLLSLFKKVEGGVVVAENGYGKLVGFADDVKARMKTIRESLKTGKLSPENLGELKNDMSLLLQLVNEVKDVGKTGKVTDDILKLLK